MGLFDSFIPTHRGSPFRALAAHRVGKIVCRLVPRYLGEQAPFRGPILGQRMQIFFFGGLCGKSARAGFPRVGNKTPRESTGKRRDYRKSR